MTLCDEGCSLSNSTHSGLIMTYELAAFMTCFSVDRHSSLSSSIGAATHLPPQAWSGGDGFHPQTSNFFSSNPMQFAAIGKASCSKKGQLLRPLRRYGQTSENNFFTSDTLLWLLEKLAYSLQVSEEKEKNVHLESELTTCQNKLKNFKQVIARARL